jgi:hypothetical protein
MSGLDEAPPHCGLRRGPTLVRAAASDLISERTCGPCCAAREDGRAYEQRMQSDYSAAIMKWDRGFESGFLQRRVCELSVPLEVKDRWKASRKAGFPSIPSATIS